MPFLVCGQPKRFLPRSGVFFFLCEWTARLHGFSLRGARPPPGEGRTGTEENPLGSEDPIFGKTLSCGYSFETVLDMVMGINDACYSVGPPLCFAGCGTRLPFLVFFMSLSAFIGAAMQATVERAWQVHRQLSNLFS